MIRKNPPGRRFIWKAYLRATELLYHQLAWAYDAVAWVVSFGYWSDWRRAALEYLIPGPVLETGFGTGVLLAEMVQMRLDVTGLELSPAMHRVSRRRFCRKELYPKRIRARTEEIPFSDGTFSNIVVTFPTAYVAQAMTLSEFYRVLRDAGRVVIVGLGVQFHAPILRWLTAWFLEDAGGAMVRLFAERAIEAGFKVCIRQHAGCNYVLPVVILEKEG
jgi:ubiquinone/menaquinone biosynthesis C-methylase UbiE